MVIPTLKTCHFEASEDFMTKFKSIALHIMSKHFELECMQEKALILSLKTQKLHRFLLGPIFPALLISCLFQLMALRWANKAPAFAKEHVRGSLIC